MSVPAGASVLGRVSGGDINEALRLRLRDGREAFVKTRADARPGEFEAEARGLAWLADAAALRVPAVIEAAPGHLALQWIEQGSLGPAGEEELGRGLAALHAAGAPCFGDPGGIGPTRFSELELENTPAADWPSFYAERRLAPLARAAHARGSLPGSGRAAVEQVCGRLPELAGPPEPPARLHGDLWSGNVLGDARGRPWLIDPAPYGGHREIDLAMLELFGGSSRRVLASYEEAHPLAEGRAARVALWQLLPLLVHAVLFGGAYGASAERAARSCLR